MCIGILCPELCNYKLIILWNFEHIIQNCKPSTGIPPTGKVTVSVELSSENNQNVSSRLSLRLVSVGHDPLMTRFPHNNDQRERTAHAMTRELLVRSGCRSR